MTTEFRLLRAADLSAVNEVMQLPYETKPFELRLAGVGWLAPREPRKIAHQRSLDCAMSLISTRLPGHAFWLLAGHTAWQPDSRIVRHRKLWGSLAARGLALPHGQKVGESLIEGAGGIRYFGGLQLTGGPLEPLVGLLEAEPICHLLALRTCDTELAETLIRTGWERHTYAPSIEIVVPVCSADGVVFWLVGEFDDAEAGVLALARPQVIEELVR